MSDAHANSTAERAPADRRESDDPAAVARTSVIIPAFNEAESIGDVVAGLLALYPGLPVIVVDDGSEDGTARLAEEAGATVLRHGRNMGYGASLKTGIRAAETDYVVTFDADGQHDPADVARLVARLAENDMVVGRRVNRSGVPLSRWPGKWIMARFARILTGARIPDVNSGLRGFRRTVIRQYLHLLPSRFSFSTTSTFLMLKTNRPIAYIDIHARPRTGTSTVRQFRDGGRALLLMLRMIVLFEPLKVFGAASLIAALGAVAFAVHSLFFADGGISDSTVLLGVASLLLFMSGLICDQVAALRRELHEVER